MRRGQKNCKTNIRAHSFFRNWAKVHFLLFWSFFKDFSALSCECSYTRLFECAFEFLPVCVCMCVCVCLLFCVEQCLCSAARSCRSQYLIVNTGHHFLARSRSRSLSSLFVLVKVIESHSHQLWNHDHVYVEVGQNLILNITPGWTNKQAMLLNANCRWLLFEDTKLHWAKSKPFDVILP